MILGFDTTGPYCSAALLKDGDVIGARHEEMARGQAERLFPLLEELLGEAGENWQSLEAIGVGIGPGNFTGIRLSVSAARGLALSLQKPAVGVSLLEAVTYGTDGPRLACHATRRDQVYVQGFDTARSIGPMVVRLDEAPLEWAEPGLICQGTAAAGMAERLGVACAPAAFAPGAAVARIAGLRWRDASGPPKPLYLRNADAAPPSDPAPVILDDT